MAGPNIRGARAAAPVPRVGIPALNQGAVTPDPSIPSRSDGLCGMVATCPLIQPPPAMEGTAMPQAKPKPRRFRAPKTPLTKKQLAASTKKTDVLTELVSLRQEVDGLRAASFLSRMVLENILGWIGGHQDFKDTQWEAGARFRRGEIQECLEKVRDADLTQVLRCCRVLVMQHRQGMIRASVPETQEALDLLMLAMNHLDAQAPSRTG